MGYPLTKPMAVGAPYIGPGDVQIDDPMWGGQQTDYGSGGQWGTVPSGSQVGAGGGLGAGMLGGMQGGMQALLRALMGSQQGMAGGLGAAAQPAPAMPGAGSGYWTPGMTIGGSGQMGSGMAPYSALASMPTVPGLPTPMAKQPLPQAPQAPQASGMVQNADYAQPVNSAGPGASPGGMSPQMSMLINLLQRGGR